MLEPADLIACLGGFRPAAGNGGSNCLASIARAIFLSRRLFLTSRSIRGARRVKILSDSFVLKLRTAQSAEAGVTGNLIFEGWITQEPKPGKKARRYMAGCP